MGLLIALIGMVSIKLVVADPQTVVALGDLSDVRIWLSLAGLALTGSLLFHQVKLKQVEQTN
jgi:adenine/guanine/hypoxanthine permease